MKKRKIIHYNPKLKEYARWLRNHATRAEIRLWTFLKGKKLRGYDFHRQKPIDNYILDFFCHELMLGIEVDGMSHNLQDTLIKDEAKEKRMKELGITILRFKDEEVMFDIDNVLREIEMFIDTFERTHSPDIEGHTPRPLSRGGDTPTNTLRGESS